MNSSRFCCILNGRSVALCLVKIKYEEQKYVAVVRVRGDFVILFRRTVVVKCW